MSGCWSVTAKTDFGRRSAAELQPQRLWQPFNEWWTAHTAKTGRKTTADDINRWYLTYSDAIWGPDKPTLQETHTYAKEYCCGNVSGKFINTMKHHSPPDIAIQQTGNCSRTGSTPSSNTKLVAGLHPLSAGSDSGGCSSGRGRGRGRGGKFGRGRSSQAVQHIPYHNMGSYGIEPAAGGLCGQQLGKSQPGALPPEPAYQHYPQSGQMQGHNQHNKTLGAQQPYMHTQQPAPAALTAMGQPTRQQQPQMDTELLLSPTGLQMQSSAPTSTAAVSSSALQLQGLRSSSLQLPGAGGLPGLFSPTAGTLGEGRISNLGFDGPFSFELAGLQGLQPWMADHSLMDSSLAGDLQPAVDEGLDVIGRHGQVGAQAASAVLMTPTLPAAAQVPTASRTQPGMQPHNRQAVPHQQYQYQSMQQMAAGYGGQLPQGRMAAPSTIGSQHFWHQQQVQQMQQMHLQQQQMHRQPAGQQTRQHPQRPLPGITSSLLPSFQQQQQSLYSYSNTAYPIGAFNMGSTSHLHNPNIGCNDVVPAPPGSCSVGGFSHAAGSLAAMQPLQVASAAAGSSMYRAAAPPPLMLPYTSAGAGAVQRPRRSAQGGGPSSGLGGMGYSHPSQHTGHNAAGILSELEAIKGPAMQGLVDVHITNQQQRISVSALLDAGPFGLAGRRLSQGLDPLSAPHQRLSLYGLGSDALDILGFDGLDLDTFLGTGAGHGGALHGSSGDMVAPVAPGSRTTVKVQGEATGQWNAAPGLPTAAFNGFGNVSGPAMPAASGMPAQSAAAPTLPQGHRQPGSNASIAQGVLSSLSRASCSRETAAAGVGVPGMATGKLVQTFKRKRGSSSNMGLGLDLGSNVKQQRVSGLLMELDTPRVRTLAGPLLSPRPNNPPPGAVAIAAADTATGARQTRGEDVNTQAAAGRPLSAKRRVILDLRSPTSQQRDQTQRAGHGGPGAADKTSTAPAVSAVPPPAFSGQHQVLQQEQQQQAKAVPGPCASARVLNLADEYRMPPSVVLAPMPTQSMLTSTLSGPVGALGADVCGMGCVAQVMVSKAGSKGFLPAMHEIERMI